MKTDDLVAGESEQSRTSQGESLGGEIIARSRENLWVPLPLAPTRALQHGAWSKVSERSINGTAMSASTPDNDAKVVFSTINIANLK
jgi:hypothetical protein